MRSKRPRQASRDQVSITREGDVAVIENADPSISVVRFTIGPDLGSMTDAAILELFNDVIEAQEKLASNDDTLIEIPPGKPQIRYSEGSDQWVPRGDVLRCHLDDDEANAGGTDIVDDIGGTRRLPEQRDQPEHCQAKPPQKRSWPTPQGCPHSSLRDPAPT